MSSHLKRFAGKIREINQHYAKPRIEMSGAVKVSLMALRVYLLVLVALLVYKFVMLVR
jgi:hypothetical protein